MLRNMSPQLAAGRDHSPVVEYPITLPNEQQSDEEQQQFAIRITQKFSASDEFLGGCNWRGAALLARVITHLTCLQYLRMQHLEQPGKQPPVVSPLAQSGLTSSSSSLSSSASSFSAIELGAGTGLVSLAAAVAPGGFFSRVIATEMPGGILNLLRANVESNNGKVIAPLRRHLGAAPVKLSVLPVTWGQLDALDATVFDAVERSGRFDFVLGSELTYCAELNSELLSTLLALTATVNPVTGLYPTIVISNDTRAGDAGDDFFFKLAAKYFVVDKLPDELLKLSAADWLPLQTREEGVFVLRRRHGVVDHNTQMARFRRERPL